MLSILMIKCNFDFSIFIYTIETFFKSTKSRGKSTFKVCNLAAMWSIFMQWSTRVALGSGASVDQKVISKVSKQNVHSLCFLDKKVI